MGGESELSVGGAATVYGFDDGVYPLVGSENYLLAP